MSLALALVVFRHLDDADHAFADAYEDDHDAPWLTEAAVVEHHRRDRIVVRGNLAGHYIDADDEGDAIGKRTLEGALTGAVVGAIFGPAGFAAGLAAGGTVGGVAQAESAPRMHAAFFDEIRAEVPQKSSAIVLLAAKGHVDDMIAALKHHSHARVVRHQLSEQSAKSLQEAASAKAGAA